VPGRAPFAPFFTVGKTTVSRQRLSSARAQSSVARSHTSPFSSPDAGPSAHEPPIAFGLCAYAGIADTRRSSTRGFRPSASCTTAARTNQAGGFAPRGTPV
jgi:hypothetical protein